MVAASSRQQSRAKLEGTLDYRWRLEAIGRFLDNGELRAVAIIEVGGGMLVRATRQGHREPELFEFADAEPESWEAPGDQRRGLRRLRRDDELFHDGYAESFATLGSVLDLTGATQVTITEGDRYLAVGALYPTTLKDGVEGFAPVSDVLLLDDIRRLHAGELPVHLIRHEPTPDDLASRQNAGHSLAGALGGALSKVGAALSGLTSRDERAPQRAAAD